MNPRRPRIDHTALLVCAILIALLHPEIASCDWLPFGTPVATDGIDLTGLGTSIPDGAGGVIVPFAATDPGGRTHVYAQRFDGLGAPLWGAGHGVVVSTPVAQDQY